MILPFLRKTPVDAVARAYAAGTARRVARKTPADRLRFLVIDAETTGFKLGLDRLLSLAVVEASGGRIQVASSQSWLVYQPGVAVNRAVAIHCILPSETAGGRPEKEVLAEMLPRLTGAILVGHHVGFDAAMLDEALRRHFSVRLQNPLLDTAKMAMSELEAFRRTAYPGHRPPGLDEVCANLGLPMHDRHTAAGDAFTTAQLFLLLCARARRRLGRPLRAGDLPLARL